MLIWLLVSTLLTAVAADPPAPAASASAAPPAGPSIGGEPILHQPVVLGAMATEAVTGALDGQKSAIQACYDTHGAAGLSGKVLVRFSIGKEGQVKSAEVKSTSLRHPATEACVVEVVKATRFPQPGKGGIVIASVPFDLPTN